MLSEVRRHNPLGSVSPLTSSPSWKEAKCSVLQRPGELQRSGELQRGASSQRSCFLGVETWPELVWQDWDLGREFTKTLVLKNVHSKLQKLRFRPPTSRFFTTPFPQIIALSPGTSFSLPVTFRPLQRCEYEDSIEFQSKDGSFQVCLRATLPCHALLVPESVLLPLCAVQHSSHANFLFRNASKLQTCFQWEVASPFQLSPERGVLGPGQECRVTAVFRPQEALVYQREACCRFGEEGEEPESTCTVLLQGPAKYPCLQLRTPDGQQEEGSPVLQFGSVAVGGSVERHFDIHNPSPVTASFSLSCLRAGGSPSGSEFSCDVTRGEVAPGASLRATVRYAPVTVDTVSVDYLTLTCPGALSRTLLKLTASCIGPRVTLSSSVVDFGSVEEGGDVMRTVELVNSSPAEAVYKWDLDCSGHSVFSLQPAGGVLPPHSHAKLHLLYRPAHPMAHHRRVACLVLHRDPVFLDLMGTCHSELQRPAVLRPRHLVLYQIHRARGLTHYPPDLLSAMLHERKIHLDQQGALCLEEESDQGPDSADVTDRSPMEEYYQACSGGALSSSSSSSSFSPHVTVQPAELLFNHGPSSSFSSSSQAVSVTNHTKGKVSLVWTAAPDSPFSVSPGSCDLGPLKSTSFRVTYTPQQTNTLHGAQLECFAFYKMLRDHAQVEDHLLCPPWCVTVRVIGHSFQPGREHFIPCCSLQQPLVVFPALSLLSYRTVLLQNSGDLPLSFRLDPHQDQNPSAPTVCVVPSCGLVRPGEHQILTLRTTPTEDSPRQGFRLALLLNGDKHTQVLTVVSAVKKLCISLEGDGSLYFQPTAVGSLSQRSYQIRNLSRLPVRFQWKICGAEQKLLSVEPASGELQPNESKVQIWSFNPLEETMYTLKPFLTFWPIQTPGCRKSRLPLKVMGMGSKGSLKAEGAVIDLGEVLVGGCRSFEIPLVNSSSCPVSFCLSVQQTILDKGSINRYDPTSEPNVLQLDSVRGTIASRSKLLVRSTVRPHRRAWYQWTISYHTLSVTGSVLSPPQSVCEVHGKGVFPFLQVIDARSGGSMGGLSKLQLWNLFSLDGLNEHLLSDPAPPELTYRTPTRHSVRRCPSIFTAAMLDFNFSAAPLGSEPSNAVLMFDNTGSIAVDWWFLFPEDQQIELEYWEETGEFSSTELHQMKVQCDHLFSISPSSGTLRPGQRKAVHLSYRHEVAGTDRLPVLFKLSHGREVLLNFQGMTVERDKPYLHYTSSRHSFTPVAIGGFSPPQQVYELYNGGSVPVRYKVDTAPLEQLQADNFSQPVLRCLNPEGELLPGKTGSLEWVFAPLEAKTYSVDIPIHIQGGDSMLVRFEGCGYDSQALGSAAPLHLHDAQLSVPCVQKVASPGQVVFLSEDSVSLGDIPVCCRSSRILFLTNVSLTDSVCYSWELPLSHQQVVQIYPDKGSLCPGESALCLLTLNSSGSPSFYQLDLICQVTKEEELAGYHDALRRWEEERERQQNEFTLTEKDLNDSTHTQLERNAQEPVAASMRSGPPVRKYKTLPPIRATVGGMFARPTRAERRAQREEAMMWRCPEAPRPALLHLGVTAHSHSLLEYQTHFPHLLYTHHVHRSSQPASTGPEPPPSDPRAPPPAGLPPLTHGPEPPPSDPRTPPPAGLTPLTHGPEPPPSDPRTPPPAGLTPLTHGPERDILTDTLTALIRSLLDDPAFHQALVDGASEPVPYFSQLRETPPSLPSPPPSSPSTSSHLPPPRLRSTSSAPLPQLLLGRTGVRTRGERHTVDSAGTAGSTSNRPHTQNSILTQHTHHTQNSILTQHIQHTQHAEYTQDTHRTQHTQHTHDTQDTQHTQDTQDTQDTQQSRPTRDDPVQMSIQESIRRCAEFSDVCEEVLLNTLQNLMMEAFLGELVLTARPRIIALPPVSNRRGSSAPRRTSRGGSEADQGRESSL